MYYVYFLTTRNNSTLYIGVTSDLGRRLCEHQEGQSGSFTEKYHVKKLVYFEEYHEVSDAIAREKQLKRWTRAKKNALIESKNPNWEELSAFLC